MSVRLCVTPTRPAQHFVLRRTTSPFQGEENGARRKTSIQFLFVRARGSIGPGEHISRHCRTLLFRNRMWGCAHPHSRAMGAITVPPQRGIGRRRDGRPAAKKLKGPWKTKAPSTRRCSSKDPRRAEQPKL